MKPFKWWKNRIASQALGIATAYELALKYSQERKALEKEIFQTSSYYFIG
jgi:alkylation response protein AidB-like acyl-CoA dehydrogenase